jgi:phenylalanine-4-hydroxylase
MTAADLNEKAATAPQHYTPIDGWKPGDLEFFTVKQKVYDDVENNTWKTLFKRQSEILKGRAIDLFMDSQSTLGIQQDRVPDFNELNEKLKKRTGWQLVAVPGLIPDEPFFELLANRRFPVGNFIRTPENLDYIQEPDVFHDVYGHAPILADPVFADYVQAFGEGGLKAKKLGMTDKLARLYWYTVEFGLIQEKGNLRIYGAGILSSPTESVFALESKSPHRIKFDVKRLLQTKFQIDDFQDNYFVIDSFKELFDKTYADFAPIYKELEGKEEYPSGIVLPTDSVIHKGTGEYAIEAEKRRDLKRKQAAKG